MQKGIQKIHDEDTGNRAQSAENRKTFNQVTPIL